MRPDTCAAARRQSCVALLVLILCTGTWCSGCAATPEHSSPAHRPTHGHTPQPRRHLRDLNSAGDIRLEHAAAMDALRREYPHHDWNSSVSLSTELMVHTNASRYMAALQESLRSTALQGDLQHLFHENLDVDLAPWREPRRRSNLTVWGMAAWVRERLPPRNSQRWVLVRAGRVLTLGRNGEWMEEFERPCDPIMYDIYNNLKAWAAASPSDWPDVAFYLNTGDSSVCKGVTPGRGMSTWGPCPGPVFSMIKEWGVQRDEDILVPIVALTFQVHVWNHLVYYPTEKKIDAAFFRGGTYCTSKPFYPMSTCSRVYLAYKSQTDPAWRQGVPRVDVGLVKDYAGRLPEGKKITMAGGGHVPLQELARFRYTVALDGITASSRLGRLLTINSPVLKQDSPYIEWYYRSLRPNVHYIPFWLYDRDDLLHVLRGITNKTHFLEEVATRAQAFAHQYLSTSARQQYWHRALWAYSELWPDMEDYVRKQVIPEPQPSSSGGLAAASDVAAEQLEPDGDRR